MNTSDDKQLIDRHLAGVLTPEEEARLEHLIRTSPDWARQYREAEEMVRLVRKAVDPKPAPCHVKDNILRAVTGQPERVARRKRALTLPRLAVAACVLVAVGASVAFFNQADDDLFLPTAYAAQQISAKDLARSSDVLLIGTTERFNGVLRLRVEETIFGDAKGRSCRFPASIQPGQRVALFGRYDGERYIRVVEHGDHFGIVHLDGVQPWDGADRTAEESMELVRRSNEFRSLTSASSDLESFLDSDDTFESVSSDGLRHNAEVTARFLGRYGVKDTGDLLRRLVMALDKHPEARSASAEALVSAEPHQACRDLLRGILMGDVEALRVESEQGYVVLGCLRLMQANGADDLLEDLKKLEDRLECAVLSRAATDAILGIAGEGTRLPADLGNQALPTRIRVGGKEAMVAPGARGLFKGLLVVFRSERSFGAFHGLVNVAVDRGMGVLILPAGVKDPERYIDAAPARLVASHKLAFVGFGDAHALAQAAAAAYDNATLLTAETDVGAKIDTAVAKALFEAD